MAKQQTSLEAMHRAINFGTIDEALAASPLERLYYEMKNNDPKGFLAALKSLEAAERQEKPAWDGKGACPTCGHAPVKVDEGSRFVVGELKEFIRQTEEARKE